MFPFLSKVHAMVSFDLLWNLVPRVVKLWFLESFVPPVPNPWNSQTDSWSTPVNLSVTSSTTLYVTSCCAKVSLESKWKCKKHNRWFTRVICRKLTIHSKQHERLRSRGSAWTSQTPARFRYYRRSPHWQNRLGTLFRTTWSCRASCSSSCCCPRALSTRGIWSSCILDHSRFVMFFPQWYISISWNCPRSKNKKCTSVYRGKIAPRYYQPRVWHTLLPATPPEGWSKIKVFVSPAMVAVTRVVVSDWDGSDTVTSPVSSL